MAEAGTVLLTGTVLILLFLVSVLLKILILGKNIFSNYYLNINIGV